MDERMELYIAGEWTKSSGDGVIEVENPATERAIGRVPEGTAEDVDRAVAAARAAFPGWAATSRAERGRLLRALADGLAARAEAIGASICAEVGTPIRIATRIQAALPQTDVRFYADLLGEPEEERRVGNTVVVKEPVGVVGCVTPWNYPLHQITCKVAAALAAGCPVVIKPSELAPLTAFMLMDAVHEAGFPAGVVNLVTGYGPVVGAALAAHRDVDAVSFTGSVAVGTRVAEVAAPTVKRVTLELGGKSANVILDDADLDTAVKVGVANAFLNGGQTCTAWTRMLVPAERNEEALELARKYADAFTVGDPTEPGTKLGPMVSARQRDRVRHYIETGIAEGARLVTGGAEAPAGLPTGYFVAPTVFGDVDPDSTIAQEEIFGPVLSVIAYRDEDDALAIANNSRYGLHGAVWS
ncbi:MAG TPA: aldehyde dehydrogenase family protein, partial [Jatrophihabitantaceae bacterium]